MTKEQAIEIAKVRHSARIKAIIWNGEDEAAVNQQYGFRHGWYTVGEYSIGGHEYAPGPTYND